jgi:hypothetical protein
MMPGRTTLCAPFGHLFASPRPSVSTAPFDGVVDVLVEAAEPGRGRRDEHDRATCPPCRSRAADGLAAAMIVPSTLTARMRSTRSAVTSSSRIFGPAMPAFATTAVRSDFGRCKRAHVGFDRDVRPRCFCDATAA